MKEVLLGLRVGPGCSPNFRRYGCSPASLSAEKPAHKRSESWDLIVEAGLGSGSLITAEFAAYQGREFFALGSANSPLSRGPHQLIRDGACLVETPCQILEALSLAKVGQTGHDDQVDKPPGMVAFWILSTL